jgi:uncharacterized membrane protein
MMFSGLLLFGFLITIIIAAAIGLGNVVVSDSTPFLSIFGSNRTSSSREILEQRFVRGEISRDEYESMKSCLEL